MSELLQIRTEHSRSLAEAKKYRAIHTLTELGLLVPVSEIETYHGRVEDVDDRGLWRVDPSFANGSNDNGNFNLNERSTLYAGTKDVAGQFAQARFQREYSKEGKAPAIYSIESPDADATILNSSFKDNTLTPQNRYKYKDALAALLLPLTEGSPVRFDMRHVVEPFISNVQQKKPYLITHNELPLYEAASGADTATAMQLAGAYNAYQLASFNPSYLIDQFVSSKDGIIMRQQEGTDSHVPLNLEYVARYLQNAHIVGVRQVVISATLGGRRVEIVSIFDLENVQTSQGIKQNRHNIRKRMGEIAGLLDQDVIDGVQPKKSLMNALQDVYIKPRALVRAAMEVDGYREIFKSDAGNWEGYTLAQHTEAVLNNFDENYADVIPVELLRPMRLAILAHDLGKPIAAKKGEKHLQKEYNKAYAEHYLSKIGIQEDLKKTILAIIGKGIDLAYALDVKQGGRSALENLASYARTTLENIYGSTVTQEQVIGFIEMCRMLQTCDGGAYTSMAVTSNFRNAPSFNGSFEQPIDLGKRKIKPRRIGKVAASSDLTPRLGQ